MTKKLTVFIAILMLFTFCACSCNGGYELPSIKMPSSNTVIGEGGNMLIIGEYLYFVNGIGAQTDANDYGTPEIGALMRVKLSDIDKLENEDLEENIYEMVVPKVIYSTSASSTGLYVHDNRIYFISPSISKDNTNAIENTRHDIMSVKFDGTDVKTHFTTETITNAVYFTLKDNKVFFNYFLDGSVYYIEVNANKPERKEVSDNAGALFVTDNKLFYTHTIVFKDANGNDMNQPYNEVRKCDPDGANNVVICDGRAIVDGNPSDDYKTNCIYGKTFTMVSAAYGRLLYTVATATSSAMGPDGSYYYVISSDKHQKLSWNTLSSIIPYERKVGSTTQSGFLQYDNSCIKFAKINENGIPTYTELMYLAGVTLDIVKGDTLYFKISSVTYSVSLTKMFDNVDAGGKIMTKGTKLHTSTVSTSVANHIFYENAFFYIGSTGYPYRATIGEDDVITELQIQFVPEEDEE